MTESNPAPFILDTSVALGAQRVVKSVFFLWAGPNQRVDDTVVACAAKVGAGRPRHAGQ